ncbi:MAG: hypothetical protein GTO05_03330 [Gemmatimonadales bacterium]|nr:hypothetical protein [Gemmatimonadales bacterium]
MSRPDRLLKEWGGSAGFAKYRSTVTVLQRPVDARSWWWWLSLPCGALLVAGCELKEVELPAGDPVVIVHAVMRPDFDQQFVVVERSFTGAVDPGKFEIGPIPGNSPRTPIAGAAVWVTNLDLPSDPCGNPVPFLEQPPGMADLLVRAGIYLSPRSCPTMRPGDRLELRVETPEEDVVTGMARVPGLNTAFLSVGNDSVEFGTGDTTTFNRDQDVLGVRVDASAGRLLQLQVRRPGDLSDVRATKIFADTTAMALRGDAIDVFVRGGGEDVFRAGRHYGLTVAITDTNYFDFARSRNNSLTGRGFINHLLGGVGVFGSLVATSTLVTVVGDLDDPREGVYRLTGQLLGIDVDVTMTVYLARSIADSELSAFLDGQWLAQQEVGPEGAVQWAPLTLNMESVDGRFDRDRLFVVVEDTVSDEVQILTLRGVRKPDAPFTVAVADSSPLGAAQLGSLTAVKQ